MNGGFPEGAYAGVDIGGGGTRVAVRLGERTIRRRYDGVVPRSGGRVDVPALCEQILEELRPVLVEIGEDHIVSLGIGMTGIPGLVEDPSEFDRRLRGPLGLSVLVVAGDAVITHLGALDGAEGAVVAAGTGVVTLGTDHHDLFHQVDGWGYLLGDEGSGAWIGRAGLEAALRAADGRTGGSPMLHALMAAQFGEPLDLLSQVYSSSSPGHVLASFAPGVEEAARAGDSQAEGIWRQAGTRLGEAAVAAVQGLPPRISWGGGLFRAGDLLLDPFRAEVLRALPDAELCIPAGNALNGALLLAWRAMTGAASPHRLHLHLFS